MTTGNTRILCQNCGSTYMRGSTYKPGDEFCGNCGQRLTTVDRTTIPIQGSTPIPPPPPTQKYRGPFTPSHPVVPTQPFWTRGKIIVLSALMFLIIGIVAFQLGRNSVPGIVTPLPTATTLSGTTPTATSGTTPTATSGTTPITSTSTKTPVTLKCTPTCDDPILVTIDKITINTTTQSMTWNLTLLNKSGTNQGFHFSEFSLQGSSGNKYAGTGDTLQGYTEDHSTSYNAGQTVNGTAIFSFLPSTGVTYTLTATMVADYPSNFTTISFDTITFTF